MGEDWIATARSAIRPIVPGKVSGGGCANPHSYSAHPHCHLCGEWPPLLSPGVNDAQLSLQTWCSLGLFLIPSCLPHGLSPPREEWNLAVRVLISDVSTFQGTLRNVKCECLKCLKGT